MPSFVPPQLTGLWRRESITAPGVHDAETQVVWLQTRSWYVDLRAPADRPLAAGREQLDDFTDGELLTLARVEGFAGELIVADGICAWRRDLDHQPPAPTPDEGRLSLDGEMMIEDGVHLPYREVWRRDLGSQAPLLAFRREADDGREGLMVIGGDHLVEFVARPGPPLSADASLAELVASEVAVGRRDAAITLLSTRIRYARREGGGWIARLSSLPWLEGAPMWAAGAARFDPASGGLEIAEADGPSRWRLLDASPDAPGASSLS